MEDTGVVVEGMEGMGVDMVVMIANLKNNKVIIQVPQTIQTIRIMFMETVIIKTNRPLINIKALKIRL